MLVLSFVIAVVILVLVVGLISLLLATFIPQWYYLAWAGIWLLVAIWDGWHYRWLSELVDVVCIFMYLRYHYKKRDNDDDEGKKMPAKEEKVPESAELIHTI